ncbi:hypothetical protein HDU97_004240 [Phlyctochytrium planicorne]|nr:hypothetical protein HDU97_004240 [Phlyctochytrium planicorne]
MDPLFPTHDAFAASSHNAFLQHHQQQQQQQQQQQHDSMLKQRSNSMDVLGSSLLQGPVFSTSIDTPSTTAIHNQHNHHSSPAPVNNDGSFKWSSLHGMMMDPGNGNNTFDQQQHSSMMQQAQMGGGNGNDMVDMSAFINGFPYNQDPTMVPHHQQQRPSASGNEILMHLERLHGSLNQNDDGGNGGNSMPQMGGGGGGLEWNHHQAMGGNLPTSSAMHSTNDPMFASDNGLGVSMDVNDQFSDSPSMRLTPLMIPRTQSQMSQQQFQNPYQQQYQIPTSYSSSYDGSYDPSSAYDARSDTASILSTATLTTALTANTDFNSLSASTYSQVSDRSALSSNGANGGPFLFPSPIQPKDESAVSATPSTPTKRRRALTIPNSQPKTVLKAYMGLHQNHPPTPHPNHPQLGWDVNHLGAPTGFGMPLSPIPASPYGATPPTLQHANFGFANHGSGNETSPPASARSVDGKPVQPLHLPALASIGSGPLSSAPNSAPSTPPPTRVPIMPLAPPPSNSKHANIATNTDGTPVTAEELFRRLDDELDMLNFDDITVQELKEHLRVRGLPSSGKKALLVQRLKDEIGYCKARKEGTLMDDPRASIYNHVLSLHGIQPPIPSANHIAIAAMLGHHHLMMMPQNAAATQGYPHSPHSPGPMQKHLQAMQQQQVAAFQMIQQQQQQQQQQVVVNPYGPTAEASISPMLTSATSAHLPNNSPASANSAASFPSPPIQSPSTTATSHFHASPSSSPSPNPSTLSIAPYLHQKADQQPQQQPPHSPLSQRRQNLPRSNVAVSVRQRSLSDSRMTRPRLEDLVGGAVDDSTPLSPGRPRASSVLRKEHLRERFQLGLGGGVLAGDGVVHQGSIGLGVEVGQHQQQQQQVVQPLQHENWVGMMTGGGSQSVLELAEGTMNMSLESGNNGGAALQ